MARARSTGEISPRCRPRAPSAKNRSGHRRHRGGPIQHFAPSCTRAEFGGLLPGDCFSLYDLDAPRWGRCARRATLRQPSTPPTRFCASVSREALSLADRNRPYDFTAPPPAPVTRRGTASPWPDCSGGTRSPGSKGASHRRRPRADDGPVPRCRQSLAPACTSLRTRYSAARRGRSSVRAFALRPSPSPHVAP